MIEQTEQPEPPLVPAKFTMDFLAREEPLDGFTDGSNWNGWACPFFTFEQAQVVLQTFIEERGMADAAADPYYDPKRDAFIFPEEGEEPGAERENVFTSEMRDGQKYYGMGGFWCWNQVT